MDNDDSGDISITMILFSPQDLLYILIQYPVIQEFKDWLKKQNSCWTKYEEGKTSVRNAKFRLLRAWRVAMMQKHFKTLYQDHLVFVPSEYHEHRRTECESIHIWRRLIFCSMGSITLTPFEKCNLLTKEYANGSVVLFSLTLDVMRNNGRDYFFYGARYSVIWNGIATIRHSETNSKSTKPLDRSTGLWMQCILR